jgi:hypothetical protein
MTRQASDQLPRVSFRCQPAVPCSQSAHRDPLSTPIETARFLEWSVSHRMDRWRSQFDLRESPRISHAWHDVSTVQDENEERIAAYRSMISSTAVHS